MQNYWSSQPSFEGTLNGKKINFKKLKQNKTKNEGKKRATKEKCEGDREAMLHMRNTYSLDQVQHLYLARHKTSQTLQ